MEPRQPHPVTPKLREAESVMEKALSEACAGTPPTEADTGELIRVEQMLEIATDAAKEAIAQRQRRREARERDRPRGTGMGDAEAAASQAGTHRAFTDAQGLTWDVFAVFPEASFSAQLRGSFQQGWLCFDSGTEKRRFSPIPESWQQLPDEELERLASRAERARPRRGRRSGEDQPGPAESSPPTDG